MEYRSSGMNLSKIRKTRMKRMRKKKIMDKYGGKDIG